MCIVQKAAYHSSTYTIKIVSARMIWLKKWPAQVIMDNSRCDSENKIQADSELRSSRVVFIVLSNNIKGYFVLPAVRHTIRKVCGAKNIL